MRPSGTTKTWWERARGWAGDLIVPVIVGGVVLGLASLERAGTPSEPTLREAAERGRVGELETAPAEELGRADGSGVTPLLAAARCGRADVVEILIRRGVDVNARVPIYGTAMSAAATFGEAKVVRVLLAHGADVGARSEYGRDALMAAAVGGDVECVRVLLAAGADPRCVDKKGWSALRHATEAGNAECARVIAEATGRVRN